MVLIYKSNRYYASHVHVQWRLRALAVDPNIPRIIYYIFTVLFCSRPKLKKNAGQNPCLVLRYLILKCGILDFRLGTISENVILHLHISNLMPCGFKLSLWHRRLIWQTDFHACSFKPYLLEISIATEGCVYSLLINGTTHYQVLKCVFFLK